MVDGWNKAAEWMEKIKTITNPKLKKGVVLTHNGFYFADSPEATNSSNQITEADYDRVIKKGAADVADMFIKTKRYAVRQTGSYSGKHILEDRKGYYMTNGEFILASFISGLFTGPDEWCCLVGGLAGNRTNVSLNIVLPMKLKELRH